MLNETYNPPSGKNVLTGLTTTTAAPPRGVGTQKSTKCLTIEDLKHSGRFDERKILSGNASPTRVITQRPQTGRTATSANNSYDHHSLRMLQRPSHHHDRPSTKDKKSGRVLHGSGATIPSSSFSSQFNRFRNLTLHKSRNDKQTKQQSKTAGATGGGAAGGNNGSAYYSDKHNNYSSSAKDQ